MSRRNKSRKRRKKNNKFFMIIAIISTIIAILFGFLLIKLDMLPEKYLTIGILLIGFIYFFMLLFTFIRKIKFKIKVISCIFFILFGLVFGFGIKYLSDTINFFDIINDNLSQTDIYYVMVLKDSEITKVKEIKEKNIGIYESKNSDKALEILNKKVEVNDESYKDVVEMFEDLSSSKIDAVLINGSIKSLLDSELSDMKLELKEIYKLSVPIEKVDLVKVVDVTRKPFNIYVAGGDAYGSIDNVTNTDVNMIITVDPVNKKILLTSIPRDYYVNLPSFGDKAYDKLTHAGYYGIEESIKTIEKLLDIDINYYIKVNFSTIEKVIDAIDGVDVNVDMAFTASDRTYSYTKGINHMNGKKALRFARERKAFKSGDVQRVQNQQKVLEAIINKITSSTTLVTNFSKILDSVGSSLSTNMDTKSINKFVKMQISDMSKWNIEKQNLVGTDYSARTYTFPSMDLYVMKQNPESVQSSKEKINDYIKNSK